MENVVVLYQSTEPLGSGVWEFSLPPSYNPPSTAGRERNLSGVFVPALLRPPPPPPPVQASGATGAAKGCHNLVENCCQNVFFNIEK